MIKTLNEFCHQVTSHTEVMQSIIFIKYLSCVFLFRTYKERLELSVCLKHILNWLLTVHFHSDEII